MANARRNAGGFDHTKLAAEGKYGCQGGERFTPEELDAAAENVDMHVAEGSLEVA